MNAKEVSPLVNPLISIVIPSYNQGRFIKETIDSILDQSYRPIEIQVIDGMSTDNTIEILKSYTNTPELNWVSEPDEGVVDAVNKGLSKVNGEIVSIQSSDDTYLPGAFACIVEAFTNNPSLGLVYGNYIKIDADSNKLFDVPQGNYSLRNFLLRKTWMQQSTVFFKKNLIAECGRWNPNISYVADADLWLRMAFKTEVKNLNAYLGTHRMHEEQRDTQKLKIVRDYHQMIDQSEDICNASPDLRRAATASKFLILARYNPTNSSFYAAWNLLRAGMIEPEVLDLRSIYLLLFEFPIRKLLSPIKRKFIQFFN